MSYVCLMSNENGAVAAGDSRETFHPKVHLDWRRKCFVIPEQQLVWAACGPTLRFGVDLLRSLELIFREAKPMEKRLEKIRDLVNAVTRLTPWAGDPGPFCLLIANMEEGRLTVRNCRIHKGALLVETRYPGPGEPVTFHAGAWHRAMPPLPAARLEGLSYGQLQALAEERVRLAIALDKKRRAKNPDHNQTIGGRVRLVGLRIKRK